VSRPSVLFLGGNGHSPARLAGARAVLQRERAFDLDEVVYPRAASWDALLADVSRQVNEKRYGAASGLAYATGVGALVALALRARGRLPGPLVVQGGVLWGLETRLFPRLMRIPPLPRLLAIALRTRVARRSFAAHHFRTSHPPEVLDAFFDGYRDADAFIAWFRWLRPPLLRSLERGIAGRPRALEGVEAWWGVRDSVVGPGEWRATERALACRLPLRVFAGWGHYPMLDDPRGWVEEVGRAVAAARSLR
jgi:hypothetical protein